MSKIRIFLLIVIFGALCILGFHIAVFMIKFLIGAMIIGLIVLGVYIGRETSKHR